MLYSVHINQVLLSKENLTINQGAILEAIRNAQLWADTEVLNGTVFYWIARQKICDELCMFKLKTDTIYRHLKNLNDLGLIIYEKKGKKDLVYITDKLKKYYVGNKSELLQNSEINPKKLGNKSEKNSEINPTDNNTRINNNTKDNNRGIDLLKKENPNLNIEAYREWIAYKGKSYSNQGKKLSITKLCKYSKEEQKQMVEDSILNGWKGLFKRKQQSKKQEEEEFFKYLEQKEQQSKKQKEDNKLEPPL